VRGTYECGREERRNRSLRAMLKKYRFEDTAAGRRVCLFLVGQEQIVIFHFVRDTRELFPSCPKTEEGAAHSLFGPVRSRFPIIENAG